MLTWYSAITVMHHIFFIVIGPVVVHATVVLKSATTVLHGGILSQVMVFGHPVFVFFAHI